MSRRDYICSKGIRACYIMLRGCQNVYRGATGDYIGYSGAKIVGSVKGLLYRLKRC